MQQHLSRGVGRVNTQAFESCLISAFTTDCEIANKARIVVDSVHTEETARPPQKVYGLVVTLDIKRSGCLRKPQTPLHNIYHDGRLHSADSEPPERVERRRRRPEARRVSQL